MAIPVKDRRDYFKEFGGPRDFASPHPGEVLRDDYLARLGISQTQLAADIAVPVKRINEICTGKRAITPETAWLLAEYFDMSVEFWARLQMEHDLDLAEMDIAKKLQRVRPMRREIVQRGA